MSQSSLRKQNIPCSYIHIAFLNIHGNFDPQDCYWTAHPDFGGQLIYVKEVSLALGRMGHRVDIITRRIRDPDWTGFESDIDAYPGHENVRIVRLPCGGDRFLRKQDLWPHIGTQWIPNVMSFYDNEGAQPDVATAHYGDSGLAAALWQSHGGPRYTFTAHSLGAHKLEKLQIYNHSDVAALDAEFFFARRIAAERVAINHAARIITSTNQERCDQYEHAAYHDAVGTGGDAQFDVIPPGVNIDIFNTPGGIDDERIAAYIEQRIAREIPPERRDLPIVICSSRLEPKKNHLGLVLAFAHDPALQAAANLMLILHGTEDLRATHGLDGAQRHIIEEIAATCETAGLWDKVIACSLDSQAELAATYRHLAQRRSAFALTALYEPFGLAPLEAMAAGLPACVTRCGGPSETLYDPGSQTEFGVLVDPAQPADIARGLMRLIGPDNEWQHFRDTGREHVLKHYTWEATARGYASVLRSIVADAPAPDGQLPIPEYFINPRGENDITLEYLRGLLQG